MEWCENVEGVAPVCHQVTLVEHDRVTVELSQHRRVKALGLCKAALIRLINKPSKNHRPTFDHRLSSDSKTLTWLPSDPYCQVLPREQGRRRGSC